MQRSTPRMLCIGKYPCIRWCLLRSRCVLRKCFPRYQGKSWRRVYLNFSVSSGKISKEAQPRDFMNMISGRRIHLQLVPGISLSHISIQSRCGKPLAQKFLLFFRQTLLKLCLTRLVMWFLVITSSFNQYWISSRTLDRGWNNSKASWTRGYWLSFG